MAVSHRPSRPGWRDGLALGNGSGATSLTDLLTGSAYPSVGVRASAGNTLALSVRGPRLPYVSMDCRLAPSRGG